MTKTRQYLELFKVDADNWFKNREFVSKNYAFFQEFFKRETLESAKWETIQDLGKHLHSMQSLAIARGNAFGRPNHKIEYYRNSFVYLAHGADSIETRMRKFMFDDSLKIAYLGKSSCGEIFGYLFADQFIMYNERTKFALKFLGIEVPETSGGDFIDYYVSYNESANEVVTCYKEIVGQKLNVPIRLEIDQFFSYLYEKYSSDEAISEKESDNVLGESQYWLLAAGTNGEKWEFFQRESIIAIGYKELKGSILDYQSKKAIKDVLVASGEFEKDPSNHALACAEFAHVMKPGDYVFIKSGLTELLALGKIDSEYIYDSTRDEYKHLRRVKWIKTGHWNSQFPQKTLTKLTSQSTVTPEELLALMGVSDLHFDATAFSERNYWWLNANPEMWDPREWSIGKTQTYTALNKKGNKRRIFKHFEAAKPGDIVVGYLSSPHRQVTCLFEVTKGLHRTEEGEVIEFKKTMNFAEPLGWDELKQIPELKDCEPLINNQGSLFKLTKEEFEAIKSVVDETNLNSEEAAPVEAYSIADAMRDLFIEEEEFQKILRTMSYKKNIILQGPPGVGKTFAAKRLAFALLGMKSESQVEMIQFHQSYSYEDFIQGYRPKENGGFERKNGVFYEFCAKAIKNPDKKFIFIIDEINRGNLGKIFGELLMLLETDKRGAKFAVPLAYSNSGEKFFVPENLYLLGMMNTADRSLSLVDYALRRRFAFFDIKPAITTSKFREYLKRRGADESIIRRITERVSKLNLIIAEDKKNLGPGFEIGHSYFCPINDSVKLDEAWFQSVIDMEIASLLREYWFDDEDKVKDEIKKLAA